MSEKPLRVTVLDKRYGTPLPHAQVLIDQKKLTVGMPGYRTISVTFDSKDENITVCLSRHVQ